MESSTLGHRRSRLSTQDWGGVPLTRSHQLRGLALASLLSLSLGVASRVQAQGAAYRIAEADLAIDGVSASVEPVNPVVPKNVASGLRVVVKAGGRNLTADEVAAFLGGGFEIRAELAGPGLPQAVSLPVIGTEPPADRLLLPLPALTLAGEYSLTSIRLAVNGADRLDVGPARVTLKVLDQILITSVRARPLTFTEIQQKGILLDDDAYLGFEFTLGLKLESEPVNVRFPVVFDRRGVAIPPVIPLPPVPDRQGVDLPPLPTIVPLLLTAGSIGGDTPPDLDLTMPDGQGFRIPSLLVIPGNVGYLKQFFSAQLFVADGAPLGSGLVLREVQGTVHLPPGPDLVPGTEDDPLALAPLQAGGTQPAVMAVRGVGPDGEPGTPDDVAVLGPGEQGQAEFLLRGEKEGFHNLDFDIAAVLEGLPVGPVTLTGKASGGVLVRNPYFDVTFTVPTVVRRGERFRLYATVTNLGQTAAYGLNVNLDASRTSGARLVPCDQCGSIPELPKGDSRTVEFLFDSESTGQVVASYLRFNLTSGQGQPPSGQVAFYIGVGERGVPLSPDTLVLPTNVDVLPQTVVERAMRVLGQAWSLAQAPNTGLSAGVERTTATVVRRKALALAEAGLRIQLGQAVPAAVRDLVFDFYGGSPLDPGFDQALRETEAGRDLARSLGLQLDAAAAGGPAAYERQVSQVALSAGDFLAFSVRGDAPTEVVLTDAAGRRTRSHRSPNEIGQSEIPGAVVLPLGAPASAPLLGILTAPTVPPYTLEVAGPAELSLSFPGAAGSVQRGVATTQHPARIVIDFLRPDVLVANEDADGDGTFETPRPFTLETLSSPGPGLVAATVIGPETLDQSSPFGLQAVFLFDRVVEPNAAADPSRYRIPANAVVAAKAQLSGRLVFAALDQPEGPYVPTTVEATGIPDLQGVARPGSQTVALASRIQEAGAVVSGRVVNADGTPYAGGSVFYKNYPPRCGGLQFEQVVSAVRIGNDGRYELRYVAREPCGSPFSVSVFDPVTGAARSAQLFVRTPGEQITADLALLGHGSVTGVVRDHQGVPVPAARVVAISVTDPTVGGAASTDGDGRYLIHRLPVGAVNLRAAHDLYVGQGTGRIGGPGATADVDIRLEGGSARISGRVYRLEAGNTSPIPHIPVLYRLLPPNSQLLGVTHTDADGRYAFEGMPPGEFRLEAFLNTRDFARIESRADTGQTIENLNLVIEIPPDTSFGEVRGTVRMPNGAPAAAVVVSVGLRGVVSGADGSYAIPGIALPSNPQVMAATRDGLRTGSAWAIVTATNPVASGIDVTLSGLGAVEFTLLDPAGQAVAGQAVSLLGGCNNPCGCRTERTGSDGRVRFEGLRLGTAWAKAVRISTVVDVVAGSASVRQDGMTGYQTLRLAGWGTVTGTVRDATTHAPLHGADVTLRSNRFKKDLWTCELVAQDTHAARSDANGRFTFTGVNAGAVHVVASHELAGAIGSVWGQLTGGQTLDLSLEVTPTIAGELSGTVYLPDGATPVGPDVEVTVNGPLPDVTVRTNAQGHYAFAAVLPQGTYTMTARDPVGGGLARKAIYLRGGEVAVHDVRLLGRGSVVVTVVDGANQVVESAQVRLRQTAYPFRVYEGFVEPANAGVVHFAEVVEGPFSVEASDVHGRGGRASGSLASNGSVPIRLALSVTGSVEGRFLMPDGTPIPFGSVRLLSSGRVLGQVTTQASGDLVGSYRFDYVPAGSLRLEAQDPATARTGLAVGAIETEGQVLPLDVRAQGLGTVQGLVSSNAVIQSGAYVDIVSGTYRVSTTTDADGRYRVPGVPEGRVVVTASLENGYLRATCAGTLEGEGSVLDLDVVLRPSGEVFGVVTHADGTAPALAMVGLSVGGQGGGSFLHTTGFAGDYEFLRVPAGRGSVKVDALGSIDQAQASVEVPPAGRVELPIRLNGVGSVRGRALASTATSGNPIPTNGTLIIRGTGAFPWGHSFNLGPDGLFELPEALAGPFTVALQARVDQFNLYGTASGVVNPGEETLVDVQLQPSGTITGVVMRAGGAVAAFGAEVTLESPRGSVMTQAQSDGRFTLRGVPLGAFTLRIYDPITTGRAAVWGRQVASNGEVVDVGTLVLDIAPPTIAVLEPAEGSSRPALGGPIVLDLADADSGVDTTSLRVIYPTGATQAASTFTFLGGRASGHLDTSGLAVGQNRVRFQVKDLAGNLGEQVVTYTATGATVRGHVRWSDGSPAAGVDVRVESPIPVQTVPDGSYVKTGIRGGGTVWVSAVDPDSGISTSLGIALFDGEERELDITFPAFGRIRGVVHHADGSPAQGVAVVLWSRTAVTGSDGRFDLGAHVLGSYNVNATDEARGDRGTVPAALTLAGQVADVILRLNGVGQLTVAVRDATGTAVASARVVVTSSSPLGSPPEARTGADGTVVFPRVLAGTITARASDPQRNLAGEAVVLLRDRDQISLPVVLEAAGRVTGTVMRRTGGGAAGVQVSLTAGRVATATTDGTGHFAFDDVRLGAFQLEATELATGDFGRAQGVVASQGAVATADITLNGVGSVHVLVQNSLGEAVAGASVVVVSSANRQVSSRQTTGAGGMAGFTNVLAGDLSITASLASNHTQGQATATLAAGQDLTLTVTLGDAGWIRGRVFAPDGTTPVADVEVRLWGATATSGADGSYEFELSLGSYNLSAYVAGRLRAQVPSLTLTTNNQVIERDLVLVGVGAVSGLVTNDQGVPAPGAAILVYSPTCPYCGYFSATAGSDGRYSVPDVPVGSFTISASQTPQGHRADGSGVVSHDGETVTVDLQLLSSAVTLDYVITDANAMTWYAEPDGSLRGAQVTSWSGTSLFRLRLVSSGTEHAFVGSGTLAATEEDKREVVIRQAGLAGLDVTRKILVARDGYFVRYLDTLQNPGTEPVTIDVVEEASLWRSKAPSVVDSASGDASADPTDGWLLIDDADTDDIYTAPSAFAPLGVSFRDGHGVGPSAVTWDGPGARLTERWNTVTVPPGGKVAFLQFLTPQADRTRGRASIVRLAQLPPEALFGLTPEEGQTVVNFAVPADLLSAVPPLPPNDGTVRGRVLGGDGATPVPSATAILRSRSLHYGRPQNVGHFTIGDGSFAILTNPAGGDFVPREAFDITASKSVLNGTQTVTATVAGAFPTSGVRDLATVPGRVLNPSSSNAYWGPSWRAADGDLTTAWLAATGDTALPPYNRAPSFELALPDDATVHEVRVRGRRTTDSVGIRRARIELISLSSVVLWSTEVDLPLPGRDADVAAPAVPGVRRVRLVSLIDGGTPGLAEFQVMGEGAFGPSGAAEQDVVLAGSGVLEGRVLRSDGTAVVGLGGWVELAAPGQSAIASPDALGFFRFPVVPPGTYTAISHHPLGALTASTTVTVPPNQKVAQDIVYPALGTVQGLYLTAAGQPLGSGRATLTATGFTRAVGAGFVFPDVPPGTYTLEGTDVLRSGATATLTVQVTAGAVTTQDIRFPPVGQAQVTATIAGSALANADVYWQGPARPGWVHGGRTDVLGRVTVDKVAGPSFEVRVDYPANTLSRGYAAASLPNEADVVPVAVAVPGVGTVNGVLRSREGVPLANQTVSLWAPAEATRFGSATTDASGAFQIPNVPAGPLRIRGEVSLGFGGGSWQFDNAELTGALSGHGSTLVMDALTAWGRLGVPGQRDLWELTLAAGQQTTLSLIGTPSGPLADPYLEVYAPDGSLAAFNNDRSTSDLNPLVTFTAQQSGAYVLVARAAGTQTGGYRLGTPYYPAILRPYTGATVQGLVAKEADGSPVAGATLHLTASRTGGLAALSQTTTGADGRFLVSSVPSDASYVLELLNGSGLVLTQATGQTGGVGSITEVTVTRPSLGQVEVVATRQGQPFAELAIQVTSSNAFAMPSLILQSGTTAADGRLLLNLVAGGTITARATDPISGGSLEASGTLLDGASLSLEFVISAGSDSTPPNPVSTLSATSPRLGTARLAWTAPGDDGDLGTATAYDLRYSRTPITEATFDIATPAVAPAPRAAGTLQTAEIGGLDAGANYFFALKTRDEAFNWSGLSNLATATTASLPSGGLKLWLKADAGVTVSTGSYLASWQDQSGNANHAAQATAASQPTVVPDEADGFPVVRFDGSDDFVTFPRITTMRTVFWVVKETPGAADGYRFLLGDASAYHFSSDTTRKIWGSSASTNIRTGETRINGAIVNGSTADRPTTLSLISLTTTANVSADSFSRDRGNGRYWMGDLAELIVYDRPLSDAERVTVENYLARKYDLFAPLRRAPEIAPNGGRFADSLSVTLSGEGVIHYTTDGSEPTEASLFYSEPLVVAPPVTVKARAFAESGGDPSPTATATYLSTAAFTPANLTGLKLWVRADAGTGATGLRSSPWTDQSGIANDLTQAWIGRQPLLVPGVVNGLPAFRFDGSDDWMSFATRLTGIRSVFWVVRESTAATPGYRLLLGDGALYDFEGGSAKQIWDASYASPSIRSGQTRVNGLVVNGTTTDRPTTMSIVSLVTTGSVTANNFSNDRNGGRYWWGDLAELIIYDSALSDADRQAVEQYLAARYGIALP